MAKVQKTVITALGEQMLFSSALTYTNATLCSQDISNLTIDQLRSLTDLTGKVLSSPISAHKRQGNTKADQVDVQVTFTNQDQKADINYSSIGWFARDRQGHETLIAVTPFVGTDTIAAAPPDGAATSSKNITLSMAAGTATEINVLIDPAGSVTPSTFNAEVDKINEALALKADNAELADYAKTADVQAGLDKKDDITDVDAKIKTVTDLANTKADANDTYNKKAVDDAFSQRDNNINNLQGELDKQVNANWAIDNVNGQFNAVKIGYKVRDRSTQSFTTPGLNLLNSRATEIDQLKGRRTVNQPDFNALTDGGSYYITDPLNGKNSPTGSWGNLFVSNGNGHRISQLYFPDDGSAPFSRELVESAWHGWIQLSTTAQTGNAQTTANQAKDLAAQANNGLAGKADKSRVNVATTLYRMIGDSDTWQKIFGVDNSDTAVLTSLRLQGGTGPLLGNFAAGVGFGGADTKGVLQVAYSDHQARITGGNGSTPVWSENIAWKSDISSLTQALTKLQAAFDAQQTKIAALQTTVNNQANQLTYFKQHYIEGKAFDADQIKQAMAWTGDDSQKLAILRDKENEGGK